jgi:7-cyano-7-deazaguanine synthase
MNMSADKGAVVVLLSGGLDSSVLLHQLRFEEYECIGLAVDYGQRHARELISAEEVARAAGVPLKTAHLQHALRPIFVNASSSQVGRLEEVPYGHYAAETMKTTIVPNRNMLLLSIAGALAVSCGARHVAYAAHAGDHAIYPDCRPEFTAVMRSALSLANEPPIHLITPFIGITKADIVRRGSALKVPFILTYSCYEGSYSQHCGRCGTCTERREAFAEAGVEDPTVYAS